MFPDAIYNNYLCVYCTFLIQIGTEHLLKFKLNIMIFSCLYLLDKLQLHYNYIDINLSTKIGIKVHFYKDAYFNKCAEKIHFIFILSLFFLIPANSFNELKIIFNFVYNI